MKIQILKETPANIDFLVEREQGMYNNVNVTAEFYEGEKDGLSQGQVYQLAWDKVKHIAYRVFNQIEPLNESENFIGFMVEPLPIPPEPPQPEPQPGIEDIMLDHEFRLSMIELGGI